MDSTIFILKSIKKVYQTFLNTPSLSKPQCENNPDRVSELMIKNLIHGEPSMIARLGAFELTSMVNYLGVTRQDRNMFKFIKGKSLQWWWNPKTLYHMQNNAGFFPPTDEKLLNFVN